MFSNTPSLIDLAYEKAVRTLNQFEVGSDDYAKKLDVVIQLHKLKEAERPEAVSRNTIAIICANLLGIFIIINAEYAHVLSAKALNLVTKPRV